MPCGSIRTRSTTACTAGGCSRWTALTATPASISTFGHGYLFFATSDTSDPTGNWTGSYFFAEDFLIDYSAPGTSTDKFAFGSNFFEHDRGRIVPVAVVRQRRCHGDRLRPIGLTRTPTSRFDGFFTDDTNFSPRVAVQLPATSSRLHVVMESRLRRARDGCRVREPDRNREYGHHHRTRPQPDDRRGHRSVPRATGPKSTWRPTTMRTRSTAGPRVRCRRAMPCIVRVDASLHADRRCAMPGLCPDQPLNTTLVAPPSVRPCGGFLIAANGKDSYMDGVGWPATAHSSVSSSCTATSVADYPSSYAAYQLPSGQRTRSAARRAAPPRELAACTS